MKNQNKINNQITELNTVRSNQRNQFSSVAELLAHGKETAEKKNDILKKIEALCK